MWFWILLIVVAGSLAIILGFAATVAIRDVVLYLRLGRPFTSEGRWNNGFCYKCSTAWEDLGTTLEKGFTCYDYYRVTSLKCSRCNLTEYYVRTPPNSGLF